MASRTSFGSCGTSPSRRSSFANRFLTPFWFVTIAPVVLYGLEAFTQQTELLLLARGEVVHKASLRPSHASATGSISRAFSKDARAPCQSPLREPPGVVPCSARDRTPTPGSDRDPGYLMFGDSEAKRLRRYRQFVFYAVPEGEWRISRYTRIERQGCSSERRGMRSAMPTGRVPRWPALYTSPSTTCWRLRYLRADTLFR